MARSSWLSELSHMHSRLSTSSQTRIPSRLAVRPSFLNCFLRLILNVQVLVDAIVNTGPREDSTRIGSQGTVRRQAVDVSPLRRVNQAISLITVGVRPTLAINNACLFHCRLPRHASPHSATLNPSQNALQMNSLMQRRAHQIHML